ncbi:hypothetical protein ABZX73_01865 [Brevibacterium casei]|uniref:hypothetical protein n=1 Tax=Brevibacterium casei TaxID=33889 RepID=UPI000E65B31C|nr:hypothetical protein [Brevibacterium casei]
MSTEESRTEPTLSADENLTDAGVMGAPMIVRGILGVLFGFATVFWPRDAENPMQLSLGVGIVDLLCMVYLGLLALVLVYQALRSPLSVRTAVFGQAIVTVPAIVFLAIADTPAELRAALSIWAILHGLIELWNYRKLVHHPMATDFLISAAVHILLGIILLAGDTLQALDIVGFTGAAALIAGVIFIIGGYSRISKVRQARRTEESGEKAETSGETAADDV